MTIVLLSQDLMIGSRLAGAARNAGRDLVTLASQQQAVEACGHACSLLFVDLRLPGLDVGELVASVRSEGETSPPIVACGPHVHEANLAAARDAGCDAVLTRGQFDREIDAVISRFLDST